MRHWGPLSLGEPVTVWPLPLDLAILALKLNSQALSPFQGENP